MSTGQRREDDADLYYVVEASITVGIEDVHRAVERTAVARLGRPAVAAVAGTRIDDEAARADDGASAWGQGVGCARG